MCPSFLVSAHTQRLPPRKPSQSCLFEKDVVYFMAQKNHVRLVVLLPVSLHAGPFLAPPADEVKVEKKERKKGE
jgi:hypothetical protein